MSAPGTFVELPRDDARGHAAATNVDVELGACRCRLDWQIRKAYRLLEKGGLGAAGHDALSACGVRNVTMSRDSRSGHLEPNQLASRPGALLLLERRLPDEVAFLPADDPA
jgi:hypothetical protein